VGNRAGSTPALGTKPDTKVELLNIFAVVGTAYPDQFSTKAISQIGTKTAPVRIFSGEISSSFYISLIS
jgi:hypothetical protein